jgi:hypothetical protein
MSSITTRVAQWHPALLVAACIFLSTTPTRAQEVLACYTLHNDLANFDRRAHSVDHYFLPALRREVGPRNLRRAYDRSHLGGSDIVRLRLINEMRRFGCPIAPRDEALLDAYYRRHYARKVLLPIDK